MLLNAEEAPAKFAQFTIHAAVAGLIRGEKLLLPFAKAIASFIDNRTIRQDTDRQNIILNRHRILKIAFAIKKLSQLFHYIISDFTLRCLNGWV